MGKPILSVHLIHFALDFNMFFSQVNSEVSLDFKFLLNQGKKNKLRNCTLGNMCKIKMVIFK